MIFDINHVNIQIFLLKSAVDYNVTEIATIFLRPETSNRPFYSFISLYMYVYVA